MLVVLFCASINYVGGSPNKKWDLACFRTTRPSEATRKIVGNLGKPIKATLFFANPNEVRELVLPVLPKICKHRRSADPRSRRSRARTN